MTPSSTFSVSAAGADVSIADFDGTRTYLVLHGGGGTATVQGFAALLAERTGSRVLAPTHPGFGGTSRPPGLTGVADLAAAYLAVLDDLGASDVIVVGNSFGGWIAAEMALLGSARLARAVIVDGVGIVVDGHPVASVAGLAPADLAKLSFHDPAKAPRPPAGAAGPSPDIAALISYTGPTMADPTLAGRLAAVDLPVDVIWGESDGIVDTVYGRAYADAIPGATFTVLAGTGHLPQVETPDALLGALLGA